MIARVLAVALNTYREAVRARLLLGVFALGLATCAYSLVVASLSSYGVLIAIVLGSTSLYRELEHKTVFSVLSRPVRRWEYLVGKYMGTLLTVAVFVAAETAAVLA